MPRQPRKFPCGIAAGEDANTHGESLVEAGAAKFGAGEFGKMEFQAPGSKMAGVAPFGSLDHRRGTVDRHHSAANEAIADQGDGDAMAAADLQNPFARLGRKQFHDPADPLIPHRHHVAPSQAKLPDSTNRPYGQAILIQ